MKSMMLISATLLGACVSSAETCESYGFKAGTDAHADCQIRVDADNSARRLAALQHMQRASTPTFSPPSITTCRPIAGGVQCY